MSVANRASSQTWFNRRMCLPYSHHEPQRLNNHHIPPQTRSDRQPFWPVVDHKDKLPKDFSYAVGTRQVCEWFADIPQAAEMEIHYTSNIFGKACHWSSMHCKQHNLPILSVWRCFQEHPLEKPEAAWEFLVYPVPKEWKHWINRKFLHEGRQRVLAWLRENRAETWLQSDHKLICYYRPIDRKLILEET